MDKKTASLPMPELKEELDHLEFQHLLRKPKIQDPSVSFAFASNDYLGLKERKLISSFTSLGSGASRLVTGNLSLHEETERLLSEFLEEESSLLFTSGYAANVGALSALLKPEDTVLSDELNHASIIDGIRLSKAKVIKIKHLDIEMYEAQLKKFSTELHPKGTLWIVTESYFSMDADSPDLKALEKLATLYQARLYVDEAHALGVFGKTGAGILEKQEAKAHVRMLAFGKAFGLQGGSISGTEALRLFLWNKARSFVFSTGLSPLLASEIKERLLIQHEDGKKLRELLRLKTSSLREGIGLLGLPVLGHGPILPLLLGSEESALRVSENLLSKGYYVPAIRPPTVPKGTSRLRITASLSQSEEDIASFLKALKQSL